jgi:signal transduction histidine kinase
MLMAASLLWWHLGDTELRADAAHATAPDSRPHPVVALALSGALAALFAWMLLRIRRHTEQARQARTQLQALGDVLDVWQWHTDAEHRLVLTRPPFGAPAKEWAALPKASLLWDHFQVADEPALKAQMANGAALDDVEVWRKTLDAGAWPGRLRGRAISDASGAFAGYVGTLRESSGFAAPAVSPELVEPAAAAAAQPTSANGDQAPTAAEPKTLQTTPTISTRDEHEAFGYTVSHDLRAPIRIVEGFAKIVKEDYGGVLDRVGHDHLDRVIGAATRMNSMIDALLALSRLSSQPLACQSVNLSQLARFVGDDLQRLWPDRVVRFEVMEGLHARGDPTLLRLVLENLIGNAWKYTGHCADAWVSFERTGVDPATFTVSDNGAGFDMRFADRLFGVFQRLHSASEFPGTGVGLASVRRIVRRHGGEIRAEGEPDHGARFHFTLPEGVMRP